MDATQLQKNNEKFAICSNMDDLEDIMLSEISQRKNNAAWYHLYVESKKYNKLVNEWNIKRSKLRYREQTSGSQWGEGRGIQGWEGEEPNYWHKRGSAMYCTMQGTQPTVGNTVNGKPTL